MLSELLTYSFAQRAIIIGIVIALVCSILGVFLVLRRLSLIGDGLSHVAFASATLGLLLKVNALFAAIPITILGGYCIVKLMNNSRLSGDASIGIVSSASIAIAVMIVSFSGGFNIDLFSFLFGNILAVSTAETIIALFLALVVLFVIILFYHDFVAISFDEDLAQITGVKTYAINNLLVLLTAFAVAVAMRLVGVMLVSALLIIPPVSAFYISKSFKSSIIISSIFGILSVVIGVLLSFVYNLPTSATIVILSVVLFLCMILCKQFFKSL